MGLCWSDVRNPDEFKPVDVKGSVNIPLDQIANKINQFKGKNRSWSFAEAVTAGWRNGILHSNGITNVINGGSWQDVTINMSGKTA